LFAIVSRSIKPKFAKRFYDRKLVGPNFGAFCRSVESAGIHIPCPIFSTGSLHFPVSL
jgi:hypothetical protein